VKKTSAVALGITAALALPLLATAPATAAAPAVAAPAAPAPAASTVSDAVFHWGISNEANNASFAPGLNNILSAGKAPKTSGADTIAQGEWSATSGAVTIEKKKTDGSYATATWAGLKTTPSGEAITSATSGKFSDHRVAIADGSGTLDADADDADIQWTGDFTVAFYGGMTQFFVSDPHLDVTGGAGELTATLSGFGTSMSDPNAFVELPTTVVTLADLSGVDVTDTGIQALPDYLGVEATLPESATPQSRTGDSWGAFPQSMVDYQVLTGQSSYWYSSGMSTDAFKVALPITVDYTVDAPATGPQVTVSKTENLDPNGETITVSGTGFLPHAPETNGVRPPLTGFAGAYVAFGTFLDTWKPSENAPGSARGGDRSATKWLVSAADLPTIDPAGSGAGAELAADGSFSVTITVKKGFSGLLANGNYGIYTYAGGGAKYAPFETYTPVTFAAPDVERISGADRFAVAVNLSQEAYPGTAEVAYLVTGTGYADALSAAPAAVKEHAPLLLTAPDALPAGVKAELQRLQPEKIVIVGGTNSVSEAVKAAVTPLADEVVRISGPTRFDTSRSIVDYAFTASGAKSAYLATGANFPDALSASAAGGSAGAPVILVDGNAPTIDAATSALLTGLKVDKVAIAGGTNSVSAGIQTAVATLPSSTAGTPVAVSRLSGADRFATSIAVNGAGFGWAGEVYLATGLNFPDALAGAALAGLRGAPLYVVPTDCVPQGTVSAIDALGAGTVTLLGGTNALGAGVASLTPCGF
jgi:putative cell wall-binding protein